MPRQGAIFGVTIGTFLSFALLSIIYLASKKRKAPLTMRQDHLRSRKTILKELILIAIPITIGASVSSLTTLIDMATITRAAGDPAGGSVPLFLYV